MANPDYKMNGAWYEIYNDLYDEVNHPQQLLGHTTIRNGSEGGYLKWRPGNIVFSITVADIITARLPADLKDELFRKIEGVLEKYDSATVIHFDSSEEWTEEGLEEIEQKYETDTFEVKEQNLVLRSGDDANVFHAFVNGRYVGSFEGRLSYILPSIRPIRNYSIEYIRREVADGFCNTKNVNTIEVVPE